MRTIQIKNLRSLRDTGIIKLKPITILVGINSSGKSTFLRAFPLLKQSTERRIVGPIAWVGNYVDFGSFSNAVSSDADRKCIEFNFGQEYSFPNEGRPRWQNWYPWRGETLIGTFAANFSISVKENNDELNSTYADSIIMELAHEKKEGMPTDLNYVKILIGADQTVNDFRVNNTNILQFSGPVKTVQRESVFPSVQFGDSSPSGFDEERVSTSPLGHALASRLSSIVGNKSSDQRKNEFILKCFIGDKADFLRSLQTFPEAGAHWRKCVRSLSVTSHQFEVLYDLFIAFKISSFLDLASQEVLSLGRSVSYAAPVRATVERYYRNYGLAADAVDPQGKNLAAYIHGMTISDRQDFVRFTREHIGFEPTVIFDQAHLSLRLKEVGSRFEYNMADLGFGFSQILPILAQMWRSESAPRKRWEVRERLLAIEQPELHLHPKLQARVSDLIVASIASNSPTDQQSFVIETHSESIINRFGQLIRAGRLHSDAAQVIIFEKDENHIQTNVRSTSFNEDGSLSDWPYGFFLFDDDLEA